MVAGGVLGGEHLKRKLSSPFQGGAQPPFQAPVPHSLLTPSWMKMLSGPSLLQGRVRPPVQVPGGGFALLWSPSTFPGHSLSKRLRLGTLRGPFCYFL